MDIFESLKNLNVSEECFDDIVTMVEAVINELDSETEKRALKERERRTNNALATADLLKAIGSKGAKEAEEKYQESVKKFVQDKEHIEKGRNKK